MTAFADLPATDAPRLPGRLPALAECLVLAALLHLLAVALLGNAPGGTARPGEGTWGAINVRLAGTGPPRSDAETPPPDAYSGPPGPAAERRWGGSVRDSRAEAPAAQPGAARLGTWNAAPTAADADPLPPPLAPAARAAPDRVAAPAPAPLPETAPETAPEKPPEAAPALRALVDNGTALREIAPLPTAPAPLASTAVAPAPAPEFVPLLRPTTPAATSTLQAPAPLPATPAVTSTLQTPAPLPATPTALPRQTAAEAVPLAAPAPALQAVPLAPSLQGLPTARPAEPAGAARPGEAPPPRPGRGAPDAGAAVGHDIATPPTAAASQPRLNLELPRPRGGELSRLGSRGVVNLLPVPPEVKSRLAEEIQKSARPDCRDAYAGAGLLAVVPLAADAIRKDGCRW